MKDNGTRASILNRQTSYIRAHNKTSEEIITFRFNSQYAYHSDGLCSMWKKNIRWHSEPPMRLIVNSEKHFLHRIQYINET